jgi:hypothetical protein
MYTPLAPEASSRSSALCAMAVLSGAAADITLFRLERSYRPTRGELAMKVIEGGAQYADYNE